MATRIGRCFWVCCLLAAIAAAPLPAIAAAEPPVIEAAVRLAPAKEPALYLRFRNNKLWMATSPAGLDQATPLRATSVEQSREEEMGLQYRYYGFPETDLPLSLPGFEKARAAFHSSRQIGRRKDAPADAPADQTYLSATFSLSRRDPAGAAWTYTLNSSVGSPAGKAPAPQRLELTLPQLDPDGLKLTIETKVEERNARIGLRVKSGDTALDNVLKGKANAPATVEIVDLNGKTIVSEKGDLQKFGFT